MAFEPGKAVVVTDEALLAQYGRAFGKVGKKIALVVIGGELTPAHIELVRAAKSLLGAYTFVVFGGAAVPYEFAREGVDVVFHGSFDAPVRVDVGMDHLESSEEIGASVASVLATVNACRATDLVMGEKDFELLVAVQRAVTALRMEVKLHSLPTVRHADGLAVSARNASLGTTDASRDAALALSAALTAGAHAAEHGSNVVLDTARGVFDAAGVVPVYLELRDLGFRPAPETGDVRLLAAIDIDGERLIDNVGLPLGVGFKYAGQ